MKHDPRVRIKAYSDGRSHVSVTCMCCDEVLEFSIDNQHLAALGHTAVSVATSLGLDTNVKVRNNSHVH